MKNLIILVSVVLVLAGCGGGGSGDGENNSAAEGSLSFDQIVIPEGFNFKSSYSVTLDIDLATNEPMYLSVYGKFTQAPNGDIVADTSSRIIAGEIRNGAFKGKFTATSGLTGILIEAWYYDGARLPFRQIASLPQKSITVTP